MSFRALSLLALRRASLFHLYFRVVLVPVANHDVVPWPYMHSAMLDEWALV